MDFDSLIPIVSILATAVVALALIRLWRERHPAAAAATPATIADAQENARLAHENEALRLTVRRLEERTAVLERIATDPAERTAREIEQLR
jgi:hypothetical protein